MRRLLGLIVALGSASCSIPAPEPGDPGDPGSDAGTPYADAVIAWTEAGAAMSCTAPEGCAASTCGPTALLGAPDAVTYALGPADLVEVGLLCSYLRERGDLASPELKLWGVPADGETLVQVSYDGVTWKDLGVTTGADPELDLRPAELDVARFVRVTNRGAVAMTLDAVEALR